MLTSLYDDSVVDDTLRNVLGKGISKSNAASPTASDISKDVDTRNTLERPLTYTATIAKVKQDLKDIFRSYSLDMQHLKGILKEANRGIKREESAEWMWEEVKNQARKEVELESARQEHASLSRQG